MLLAERISSYRCTWEVWRALKKLELLEAIGPIYTIRLCRMRKAYDGPTTSLRTIYTSTTFFTYKINYAKFAPGCTERTF